MNTRAYISLIVIAAALAACHKSPAAPTTTDTTTTTTTTPTATQAPPAVTAIEPTILSADGGTVVTITGTDFVGVTNVTFGGKTALAMTINSDTSVTATAPPGTPGTAAMLAVITTAGTSPTGDVSQFTWDENPLVDMSFPAPSIRAGTTVKGSVSVKYPAPPEGLVLPLFWKITPDVSAALLYPQTAYVAAGSNVGTFQITTFYTSTGRQVEVATAHGGETRVATLTVTP